MTLRVAVLRMTASSKLEQLLQVASQQFPVRYACVVGQCNGARAAQFSRAHVGSLPRPEGTERPGRADDADLRDMIADVVARQRAIGIDVINEGE